MPAPTHAHPPALADDLNTLAQQRLTRRPLLHWLLAAGVAPLSTIACGGGGDAGRSTASGSNSVGSGSCSTIPSETAGPYPGDGTNSNGSNDVKTSQLALPAAACNQVYGIVAGYSASVANFAAVSLASDNVFGDDGAALELASVTGDAANGFAATLRIGIAA